MCSSHQDLDRDFFEIAGELQPCEHATALCAAVGVGDLWQPCGQDALEGLLHPDAPGAPELPDASADVLTIRISVCHEDLLAVRLDDGLWGLVANHNPTAAGRLRCLLCRKHHCPHTSALDAGEGGAEPRMDRDTFQAALNKHVDPATGRRRVTSLSQLPVPEEGLRGAMDDPRVADILSARMGGPVQLPRVLCPSREACSCGADAWEEYEPHECLVFGLTVVQEATWHKLHCRSAFAQDQGLLRLRRLLAPACAAAPHTCFGAACAGQCAAMMARRTA